MLSIKDLDEMKRFLIRIYLPKMHNVTFEIEVAVIDCRSVLFLLPYLFHDCVMQRRHCIYITKSQNHQYCIMTKSRQFVEFNFTFYSFLSKSFVFICFIIIGKSHTCVPMGVFKKIDGRFPH